MASREPPRQPPRRDRNGSLIPLLLSAATIAFASRWPWIEVAFPRLFEAASGPPGWHTPAGGTCLGSAALIAIMALAETRTPASRQAVRPGSLMLAVIATALLAFEVIQGPGMLRSVSARFTPWFWLACGALPVLLATCIVRFRALRRTSRNPLT